MTNQYAAEAIVASGQSREAWFSSLGGSRKTVDIASLASLGLRQAGVHRLGAGAFNATSLELLLRPEDEVVFRQGKVKKDRVMAYVADFKADLTPPSIIVTDRPADGAWWHLDGAHRLVAARLLSLDIAARVWR